jgi:hypothetical protein
VRSHLELSCLLRNRLRKGIGLKVPTAVHGLLRITYHPNEEGNVIADCLENQFTSHDLCEENNELRVDSGVQALLASVDDYQMKKVRLCDTQKLVKSLKLRKACGLDGIPNESLRHLPRRPLVHPTHLFNHCLR